MKKPKKKKYIFTEEGIRNFSAFYSILKQIHIRLISEGYIIKDGKISKPDEIACKDNGINATKKKEYEE